MKESHIQKAIMDFLSYHPNVGFVMRINSGNIKLEKRFIRLAPTGTADIIGCTNKGKFFAIEVKTPIRKNQVSEPQRYFLENIKENGGLAGVATSVEEAEEIIK